MTLYEQLMFMVNDGLEVSVEPSDLGPVITVRRGNRYCRQVHAVVKEEQDFTGLLERARLEVLDT